MKNIRALAGTFAACCVIPAVSLARDQRDPSYKASALRRVTRPGYFFGYGDYPGSLSNNVASNSPLRCRRAKNKLQKRVPFCFKRVIGTFLLAFLMLPAGKLFCQGTTATITGQVRDPSGAAVSGAEIVLTNAGTGIQRTIVTNADGYYTFPLLLPGRYQIAVTKQGFKSSATRTAVPLDVAQTARVDFSLEIGSVTQEMTVNSRVPLLQTEDASLGTVVEQTSVVGLPLNGRNFSQLATLSNGVTANSSPTAIGGTQLRSNGLPLSAVLFTIGGASVTEEHFSGISLLPPPDAIEQFKLQTSDMSAEYGQGGAAIVNVELKSGTNHLHGDIYEFMRNDALAARNYFANTRSTLKQNQFGFTLGGPVIKNRTFLFGDYQGTRIVSGQTFNNTVPTAAMKAGDFSALSKPLINPSTRQPFLGNIVSPIAPEAAFFLQYFPLPNSPSGNNIRTGRAAINVDQFDIRADDAITKADSLDVSYSYQNSPQTVPGAFPQVGGSSKTLRSQLANIRETHTFSPVFFNEFGYSYFRDDGVTNPQGLGTNYTVQSGIGGFDSTSTRYPGFPVLTISGFTALNGLDFNPLINHDGMFNGRDSVTLIRGNHKIKAGLSFRFYSFEASNSAHSRGDFTFNGTYSGNSFADFLLGLPFQGSRDYPRDPFGVTEHDQSVFVQDNWKVTSNVTLDVGLRYELHHPMYPKQNTGSSFDPYTDRLIVSSDGAGNINTTTQQVAQYALPLFANIIVPSSRAGLPPALRYLQKKDIAPRVGIAWRVADGIVVRSGYGIFYAQTEGNLIGSTLVGAPFIVDEAANLNTSPTPTKTLANMFPPLSPQTFHISPIAFYDLDPHSRTPYIQEWNLALQKVFAGAISAEVSYVGNKGTHLPYSFPLNVPPPGPGAIQLRRPFDQRFASGSYISNLSNSTYNALQLSLRAGGWHNLTMLAGYNYSKSIDYASDNTFEPQASFVQDPNNIRAERGLSDFDLRQRFTLSAIYALPTLTNEPALIHHGLGGWEISNIVTLQSGFPFTPTIATDPANTGTSKRPNRVGSGRLSNPTVVQWFNKADFSVPAPYTYGNSRRNILTGPGLKNWDLGVFKNFDLSGIRKEASVQFRAEFFNATNTPHFDNPVTNIQAANAGAITTAEAPRQIQFALKLAF